MLEVVLKPHLMSDSCVADLFKIDAHPASGGTALFHLSRHSPAFVKGRRRIGLRLLSTLI
jgi:hypothetical protein